MALFLTQTFQKNFLRLPKNIQPKVEAALQKIYSNPLAGRKLHGELDGEFSLRVGAYRIIYFLDKENNIWVETVRHRKEVYRKKGT
jgi:mRNA interferase RelE/StbE